MIFSAAVFSCHICGRSELECGWTKLRQRSNITGAPQNPIIRRIMNVVEPLRRFDLRKAFTDMVRRAASFFAPQTLQQARNGRMIMDPQIDRIIERTVDIMFNYVESYFDN
ncbi:hypothetical protein Anas_02403 [Armadillidium nasatum]|uniref:Uncharacterized protein n=1 Tax=Armadillidium nasatum TaxID=96803 RepID=A0A5N5TPH1_9CRUS|nr:hypothetical protein Anas_02403 [Armadillidium nasatum]